MTVMGEPDPVVFLERLLAFEEAAGELSEAFNNEVGAVPEYPFAESFDSVVLKIIDWRHAVNAQVEAQKNDFSHEDKKFLGDMKIKGSKKPSSIADALLGDDKA